MKKSVAITAVLALHIGVISMLLVQAGCSSEPEAPAAKAKTATEEVTTIAPAEQKEADASVRDAELPPEGSPALRVAPTRPAWNMEKADGAGETLVPETPEEPAKIAQAPAKPAAETENIYVVRRGDNLSSIAQKHRVTLSELMAVNGLSRSSVIQIGQEIKIPASGEVSALPEPKPAEHANAQVSSETETYIVKSGDSLSRIAKKYSTTVRQLMAVNNLKNHNIRIGQKLLVAKGSAAREQKTAESAAAAGEISYEIKSGDTLGAIARKHGTSVSAICKRNGISDPRKIRAGQKIIIASKAAKPRAAQPAQKKAEPALPPQPAANTITVTADAPKAPAQQPAAEPAAPSSPAAPSAPAAAPAPSDSPAQPPAPAQPAIPEADAIPVIEI